jgi:hypothetical protein
MSETMNCNYVEYHYLWKFETIDSSGAGLEHCELYDVAIDPYQMNNIYATTSIDTRPALHQQLIEYFECKGSTCH